MSNRRVLLFCWLALCALLWKVLADTLGWGFGYAGVANPRVLGGIEASALGSFVLAIGLCVALWKRQDVHDFCLEAIDETRRVVWPNRRETRDNAVVVVITSVVMSVILGVFDLLWAKLSNFILQGGA